MARLRDKVLDWWLLLKRIIANGMCCLESFSLQHACPEQGVHFFDLSGRRANVSRHASLSAWKRPRSRHYLSRTSMSIVQPWSCEPKWRYVKVYYLDQVFQELNIYWYLFFRFCFFLGRIEECWSVPSDQSRLMEWAFFWMILEKCMKGHEWAWMGSGWWPSELSRVPLQYAGFGGHGLGDPRLLPPATLEAAALQKRESMDFPTTRLGAGTYSHSALNFKKLSRAKSPKTSPASPDSQRTGGGKNRVPSATLSRWRKLVKAGRPW